MRMIGVDIIFLALFIIPVLIFLNSTPSKKKWRRLKLIENLPTRFFVISMYAQRPTFCPVCDNGLEGSKECLFYQLDSKLAREGKLPAQYDKMTRQFFAKRYAILKERAETHLHKHVTSILIDRHGEKEALRRLERTGVICSGYVYD